MEFGDYHDSYLTPNVLKLADIFEVPLDTCMIMVCIMQHSFASPGLASQATLKMLDVPMDLLIDIDMHLFTEWRIHGGVATIPHVM